MTTGPVTTRPSELLLERDTELRRVDDVLAAALTGAGSAVVVDGAAGIGKTSILTAAASAASAAGFIVLKAGGGELERQYPAGVVLDLFQALLVSAAADGRRHLLRGPARAAEPIFGTGDDLSQTPTQTNEQFALLHGLYWLVVNLAEDQPIALVVDDAQWVDELSLLFLIYLAHRLTDLPAVLLTAVRTGDPAGQDDLVLQLYGAASTDVIKPAPLSGDAVARLLTVSGAPLDDSETLARMMVANTGGNAFLVRELIAFASSDPRGWPAALENHCAAAPVAVGRSVVLRLRQLGSSALNLARAAAVLGDGSQLITAALVAGLETGEASATAQALLQADLLRKTDPLTFTHPIVRAAIYAELPSAQRIAYHKQVATVLYDQAASADLIALHLIATGPSGEPWVRTSFHEAGLSAKRRGVPATAVRYLRRALEMWPNSEDSSRISVDLALAEAAVGEPASIVRFVDALQCVTTRDDRAHPLYALGHTLYRRGRHREAAETYREGMIMFSESDPDLELRFLSAYAACANYLPAERPEAMLRLEAAAARISRPATTRSQRALLGILSLYRAASTPGNSSAELAREALSAEVLPVDGILGSIETNLAITALIWSNHAEDALAPIELVLDDARRRGDLIAFSEGSFIRALAMHQLGRITDAMADAQVAADGIELGWAATLPGPHGILINCLLERDDLPGAQQLLADAQKQVDAESARPTSAWFYWARGRVRARTGDPHSALVDFSRTGRILEASGMMSPGIIPWRPHAAAAAQLAGNVELAASLLTSEIRIANEFSLPLRVASALRVRARGETNSSAVQTLTAALAELQGKPSLLLAKILTDLGARRRRAGHPADARPELRQALELAQRLGASVAAAGARDELLAAGGRPRRDYTSGFEALTPTEERIARLVSKGHTNRAIAETLFLAKNTVEWHLRNIYRKLDIGSRQELPGALDPSRPNPAFTASGADQD